MNNQIPSAFAQAYAALNNEQKKAVDTIDGPLLVLAGPGTGKTQLLSARVANILKETDATPSNILCLTFTESGATNMRTRLKSFIGDAAYEVTISTYHSFGSELIKNYSEYFQQIALDRTDDVRLEKPVDELSQLKLIDEIIGKLPFDSSMLSARYYESDVISTISDLKKNLISPTQLKELGGSNLRQIEEAQSILDVVINRVGGISRKKDQLRAQYATLLERLSVLKGSLIEQAVESLKDAHDESEFTASTTPLTKWKNDWLFKDDSDRFVLTNPKVSEKMLDLAKVYADYEKKLQQNALYDFNDMIIRAIEGIKKNDELRYNLQERYQYILLDEFQDTNPSQFELVKQLVAHEVNEGRPNLMAVGDDDQAIFAFQGASVGNIQDFLDSFRDVQVINLVSNYRSHQDVLHVASSIASQIKTRLHHQLTGIDKTLLASSRTLPSKATIIRADLPTAAAEYAWVANQINELISSGASPREIAVISPIHHLLENFVPFLAEHKVPITYEKRENILDTEIIKVICQSAKLLYALNSQDHKTINEYFPLVISHPYWNIPALEIWNTNWQLGKKDEKRTWPEIALGSEALKTAVNFYLTASAKVTLTPLESILDQLMTETPLKSYYFAVGKRESDAQKYYDAITHLTTIRTHLRDHQASSNHALTLLDFLEFINLYERADVGLLDTHPISQGKNSVQLMTAYKAKGLEFDHVFILQAHDDIWGSSSRGRGNKISLPLNLSHIRYASVGDDERLRLFFVALTRARHSLYISSHRVSDSGKPTTSLKYLSEDTLTSPHLPLSSQKIMSVDPTPTELSRSVATLWTAGRVTLPVDFRDLLTERLESYLMSPTHLNSFMDLEYSGPEEFLVRTLLKFPSAPTADSEYGQAIHNTLEWYQREISSNNPPGIDDTLAHYELELAKRYLSHEDLEVARSKGRVVLQKYLSSRVEMFNQAALAEVNFSHEGVTLGEARLTGKIDRLEVDHTNKTVRIVDFKTGSPIEKWGSSMKAYKYRHQLYFYKFLIEGSHTWKSYKVEGARLEFVEPKDLKNGVIAKPLTIQFDAKEEQAIKTLIQVVWDKIQKLSLPETSHYKPTLQGTLSFEHDLLAEA